MRTLSCNLKLGRAVVHAPQADALTVLARLATSFLFPQHTQCHALALALEALHLHAGTARVQARDHIAMPPGRTE